MAMIECLKCGHTWEPRTSRPARCPECLSKYWDVAGRGKGKPREKQVKEETLANCSCGKPLQRRRWNSTTDCVACNNSACKQSGVVLYFIPKGKSGAEFEYRPGERPKESYESKKVPEPPKKAEDPGDILQRMRNRILAQRQTPKVP